MKKLFYTGLAGLALFEIMNVYFIMPMPGSQRMDSLGFAYFLYNYRWFFRVVFLVMIAAGATAAFGIRHKWIPALLLAATMTIAWFFNFKMAADHMFRQPETVAFATRQTNHLNDSSVVVGVSFNGETKAWPVRYIIYHHQVQDVVGGKPVIATYCSVCRTGRVFEPVVKNQPEKFRLVGMDHFNAMFEDATTKSWWRQATGEAVAGPLKGDVLPEVESFQMSVASLFAFYPDAKVMQADQSSRKSYDSTGRYERGKSRGDLTRTDSLSWKDKSWVIGIQSGNDAKAYDWIGLKSARVINDKVGQKDVVIAMSEDGTTFSAFDRGSDMFTIRHDTLFTGSNAYDLAGHVVKGTALPLKRLGAYQEFWHSWKTFHPNTTVYEVK